MNDYGITPPPLTGWTTPAAPPEPIDWAHRESLRMWRVLAARGHENAQAVVAYHGLPPLPAPTLIPAPAPAPVRALVPQAPRATVPAAPQATPALAGISRRAEMLTSLLGARPTPATPTDKNLV
jgi:hypothetical protein